MARNIVLKAKMNFCFTGTKFREDLEAAEIKICKDTSRNVFLNQKYIPEPQGSHLYINLIMQKLSEIE